MWKYSRTRRVSSKEYLCSMSNVARLRGAGCYTGQAEGNARPCAQRCSHPPAKAALGSKAGLKGGGCSNASTDWSWHAGSLASPAEDDN